MLVSTHYMDEAERCHKLAYIAYGRLLAQGTAEEIIAAQGLDDVVGPRRPDLTPLGERLQGEPGVEQTVAFGDDAARHRHATRRRSRRTLREAAAGRRLRASSRSTTGLEDVFIHLMQGVAPTTSERARS